MLAGLIARLRTRRCLFAAERLSFFAFALANTTLVGLTKPEIGNIDLW